MRFETFKKLPHFLLETLKGTRKLALNYEKFFLSERHREICFSSYAPPPS